MDHPTILHVPSSHKTVYATKYLYVFLNSLTIKEPTPVKASIQRMQIIIGIQNGQ
ncbi:MAG TPA: hypothetical protein VIJ01_18185 [Candidatus Angelobacter sp.]